MSGNPFAGFAYGAAALGATMEQSDEALNRDAQRHDEARRRRMAEEGGEGESTEAEESDSGGETESEESQRQKRPRVADEYSGDRAVVRPSELPPAVVVGGGGGAVQPNAVFVDAVESRDRRPPSCRSALFVVVSVEPAQDRVVARRMSTGAVVARRAEEVASLVQETGALLAELAARGAARGDVFNLLSLMEAQERPALHGRSAPMGVHSAIPGVAQTSWEVVAEKMKEVREGAGERGLFRAKFRDDPRSTRNALVYAETDDAASWTLWYPHARVQRIRMHKEAFSARFRKIPGDKLEESKPLEAEWSHHAKRGTEKAASGACADARHRLQSHFLVHAVDSEGRTFGHWAAAKGQVQAIRALSALTSGAALFAVDKKGRSLAHAAAAGAGQKSVIGTTDGMTDAHVTVLRTLQHQMLKHHSAFSQRLAPSDWAYQNVVSLHLPDADGMTPLHIAAQDGVSAVIQALVDLAATEDPSPADDAGLPPWKEALRKRDVRVKTSSGSGAIITVNDDSTIAQLSCAIEEQFNRRVVRLQAGLTAGAGAWTFTQPEQTLAEAGISETTVITATIDQRLKDRTHGFSWSSQKRPRGAEGVRVRIVSAKPHHFDFSVVIDSAATIAALKRKIQTHEGILSQHQHLIHSGKRLDDAKTLADYPFVEGETLRGRVWLVVGTTTRPLAGALLATADGAGMTMAHHAASGDQDEILRLLFDKGDDSAAKTLWSADNAGWRPAHHAAANGFHRSLSILARLHTKALGDKNRRIAARAAGSLPRQKTESGRTCVHLAAKEGHLFCIKKLIEMSSGGDSPLLCRDDAGQMPAHDAAAQGHVDILRFIYQSHAGQILATVIKPTQVGDIALSKGDTVEIRDFTRESHWRGRVAVSSLLTEWESHIKKRGAALRFIQRSLASSTEDKMRCASLGRVQYRTLQQKQAVAFLLARWENAANPIVYDSGLDAGYGRTVEVTMVMSILRNERVPGPFLVVAPPAAHSLWKSALSRFGNLACFHLTNADEIVVLGKQWRRCDIILTTTQMVGRLNFLKVKMPRKKWKYVVIDSRAISRTTDGSDEVVQPVFKKVQAAAETSLLLTSLKLSAPRQDTGASASRLTNAPKRAKSAYIYFSAERMSQLQQDGADPRNPFDKDTEKVEYYRWFMKQVGAEWKAMDEAARKPYQELAERDKKRYAEEMERYKTSKRLRASADANVQPETAGPGGEPAQLPPQKKRAPAGGVDKKMPATRGEQLNVRVTPKPLGATGHGVTVAVSSEATIQDLSDLIEEKLNRRVNKLETGGWTFARPEQTLASAGISATTVLEATIDQRLKDKAQGFSWSSQKRKQAANSPLTSGDMDSYMSPAPQGKPSVTLVEVLNLMQWSCGVFAGYERSTDGLSQLSLTPGSEQSLLQTLLDHLRPFVLRGSGDQDAEDLARGASSVELSLQLRNDRKYENIPSRALRLIKPTGEDADWLSSVSRKDYNGQTPLFHAAGGGHVAVLSLYLMLGCDLQDAAAQAGPSGRTLAHAAAKGGHLRFLKQLLKRGASAQLWAETTDNQMLAPADFALAHDHVECCEWLQAFLRRGASRKLVSLSMKRAWLSWQLRQVVERDEPLIFSADRATLIDGLFEALSINPETGQSASPDFQARALLVLFNGENGQGDGLRRDWLHRVCGELLDLDKGLVVSTGRTLQPNPHSLVTCGQNHLGYFGILGRLVGLALHHREPLNASWSLAFIKAAFGFKVFVEDMASVDQELWEKRVSYLRDGVYSSRDGLELADLELCFEDENMEEYTGTTACSSVELKPGGKELKVTNDNLEEYLQLWVEHRLCGQIQPQIAAFRAGLEPYISEQLQASVRRTCNVADVQQLVCGTSSIDVDEWAESTHYPGDDDEDDEGFTAESQVVVWFWDWVRSLDQSTKGAVLCFATGCARVPAGGFGSLMGYNGSVQRFQIRRANGGNHRLPTAATCFNTLFLPAYSSEQVLRERCLVAIRCGSEFDEEAVH